MQVFDYVVLDAACNREKGHPAPQKTRGTPSLSLQAVRCGGYRPCDPGRVEKRKPSGRSRGFADFFGASPVASALGIRSGATPRGPIHSNMTLGAFGTLKTLT